MKKRNVSLEDAIIHKLFAVASLYKLRRMEPHIITEQGLDEVSAHVREGQNKIDDAC